MSNQKSTRGGKILPALCSVMGSLILLMVIVSAIPVSIPKLKGYEIYNIISGSMEPAIPIGSAIYVEHCSGQELAPGDVIAFYSNDSVIAHRVVENDNSAQELVTKGDANAAEDMNKVSYNKIVGKVVFHIPVLGRLMTLYTSINGKMYLLLIAFSGALLSIVGGRMKGKKDET